MLQQIPSDSKNILHLVIPRWKGSLAPVAWIDGNGKRVIAAMRWGLPLNDHSLPSAEDFLHHRKLRCFLPWLGITPLDLML